MKHTEGNIEAVEFEEGSRIYLTLEIDNHQDLLDIHDCGLDQARANAAHIVKCWNSHPVLVDALKSISGIEAFITDREMKELFQRKVYGALKEIEK